MALWQCGICNATFGDVNDLDSHHTTAHGTRIRSREPTRPASAGEKLLPRHGAAPDAQATRMERPTGPAQRPGHTGEGHPTGLGDSTPNTSAGRGRPPEGAN